MKYQKKLHLNNNYNSNIRRFFLILSPLFFAIIISCGNHAEPVQVSTSSEAGKTIPLKSEKTNDCPITDGRHSSKIEYKNSRTHHTATYTLDVLVEDCKVTIIYFTNGGHLDDDHIVPGEISENGHAFVAGENGKGYDVWVNIQMDNN
jgi:hypothetical protein